MMLRTTFWVFYVLTLSFIVSQLFDPIFSGISFAFWEHDQISTHKDKLLKEAKDTMAHYDSEYRLSIQEQQDSQRFRSNPFGALKVNTYNWTQVLGFLSPNEYDPARALAIKQNKEVKMYADLTPLIRDTSCPFHGKKPKEQWLFLTSDQGNMQDEWNKAFAYIVRYAQGDRRLNDAAFFYADCNKDEGFLCAVWSTRAPTLVHFLVEDYPAWEEPEGHMSLSSFRPVTARIIEFPLKSAYTGRSSNILLSPEEQMLAIITGDCLYEQWKPYGPYDHMKQKKHRLLEHMQLLGRTAQGRHRRQWVAKNISVPLGIGEAVRFLQDGTFTAVSSVTQRAIWAYDFLKTTVNNFLMQKMAMAVRTNIRNYFLIR